METDHPSKALVRQAFGYVGTADVLRYLAEILTELGDGVGDKEWKAEAYRESAIVRSAMEQIG